MNRQIDKKTTKQVLVDIGLHKLLKIEAAKRDITTKELVEGFIVEGLGTDYQKK